MGCWNVSAAHGALDAGGYRSNVVRLPDDVGAQEDARVADGFRWLHDITADPDCDGGQLMMPAVARYCTRASQFSMRSADGGCSAVTSRMQVGGWDCRCAAADDSTEPFIATSLAQKYRCRM
jgi:hypothetical protein